MGEQRSPRLLAGLREPTFKGMGWEESGGKGEKKRGGMGWDGKGKRGKEGVESPLVWILDTPLINIIKRTE